jgi:crossover junction endodeoxyribonuclease RuvC
VNVLGIDSSVTSTGMAWIGADGGPQLNTAKTKADGKGTDRMLSRLRRQVDAVLAVAVRADVVLIEGLSFGSKGSATRDLAGLWWLLVDELRALDVPLAVVAPGALKKWATGNGNADKFAVGQAIARRWPNVVLDNPDEADALVLASMGLHHLGSLPWHPTAYQEAALTAVEWLDPEEARHAV